MRVPVVEILLLLLRWLLRRLVRLRRVRHPRAGIKGRVGVVLQGRGVVGRERVGGHRRGRGQRHIRRQVMRGGRWAGRMGARVPAYMALAVVDAAERVRRAAEGHAEHVAAGHVVGAVVVPSACAGHGLESHGVVEL